MVPIIGSPLLSHVSCALDENMLRTLRYLLLPALALTVAAFVAPSPAPAFHLSLTRSAPAKDSTVAAPKDIKLWYSQRPTLAVSKVTLTGPDGKAVPLGKITLDTASKAPLVVPITQALTPGAYTVKWTTASSDGHPINGTFGFKVKATE